MTVRKAVDWSFVLASPAPIVDKRTAALERAMQRERAAREQAESLLESKSREVFLANEALKVEHERVQRRNAEIEKAHAALQSTQAQLVQSEKLASVGQLAAGVAHEINNPVGFIMSNLGTLKSYITIMSTLVGGYRRFATSGDSALLDELRALEDKEDIEYVLDDIQELISESLAGTVRVKDIVSGLKSFSRVDDAQISDADLHSGIDATLKVVGSELKYKCEIIKEYGELPFVPCNLAQLNQVFMNLFVNAAQAIESNGTITVRTFTEDVFACIEVSDTGKGIPQEELGSIFDPFFTTKPVGSGTGLGLSISYGIVREHGGVIDVRSEVGTGTTFVIKIPLRDQADNAS